MQINAIRSVNFGAGRPEEKQTRRTETPNYEEHSKNVENAAKDVSPLTCVVGIATGLAALKGGSRVVGAARKLVAGAGEKVATTAVKVAKKAKKSIDLDKCTTRIHDFFTKLSLDGTKENSKISNVVRNTVDQIFSGRDEAGNIISGKGQAFVDKLKDNKIYMSGTSLFDNAVAAAGAYIAMDGMSDATESAIDRKKIEKSAIENLGLLLG